MSAKDSLYAKPRDNITNFSFDAEVVNVFPDMIQRSVPGYQTIIHMIASLAGKYIQEHSKAYDLGCSLGAASLSMLRGSQSIDFSIEAVDNSPAMMEQFEKILSDEKDSHKIIRHCQDIENITIDSASMVVMNFTLQFIPLEKRAALIKKIYQGLLPGELLVLSEKLHFLDEDLHDLFIDMHHNFKRDNGYSDLEIAQKRSSLENTLLPETANTHRTRLQEAGFTSVDQWFQCFNFASFIAIK